MALPGVERPLSAVVGECAPRAERIPALDALRATAMFLGIVYHAGGVYAVDLPALGVASDVARHRLFDVLLAAVHGFRMQLFIFLSGFFACLVHERLGTRSFLKQRFMRIGLPFALGMVTVIPLVIAIAVWGFVREGQPFPMPAGSATNWPGIPTLHLWFLLYLLYLYALALTFLQIGKFASPSVIAIIDRGFDRIVSSPWRVLAFAPLTMLCLWTGAPWGQPELPIFGLLPKIATLAYYGLFFAAGWWLHRRRESLGALHRFIASGFLIALGAFFMCELFKPMEACDQLFPARDLIKAGALFSAAVYAWTMTFVMVGVFLRFASAARPAARYFADASYWCYLAHLPIVMALQIVSSRWPGPAFLKFSFVLAVTIGLLLVIYHWRVRYTWVGALLNGKNNLLRGERSRAKDERGQ